MLWAKTDMKFGEYFKQRRKRLKITQESFPGYSQSYISNIERGINNPTQRDTIAELARTLQLSPHQVDWLWMFSLLDHDPRESLYAAPDNGSDHHGLMVRELKGEYRPKELLPGASPQDVLSMLGEPNDVLRFQDREKWIYDNKAVHVNFQDGKVVEVVFK